MFCLAGLVSWIAQHLHNIIFQFGEERPPPPSLHCYVVMMELNAVIDMNGWTPTISGPANLSS